MGFGGDCDFSSMIREALLRNCGPEMGPRVGMGVSEERAFIAGGTVKVLRKAESAALQNHRAQDGCSGGTEGQNR